eukprot:TRINITY_DN60353_c0_g1_i1.p1 TRINITY_DN60353_c0_g1~~TRINITY_DN60353_c0_g1_i1.p1  ORF type:complete len:908 (+),score=101.36 TRINITY_DN60353_c0_g1_i1:306-2726(+)
MEVQAALEKIMPGRTSIVIAHRLVTVRNCDNIVFIQPGQKHTVTLEDGHQITCRDHSTIAEMGTHHQLMKLKGEYNIMVNAQAAIEGQGKETTNYEFDFSHSAAEEDSGPTPPPTAADTTPAMSPSRVSLDVSVPDPTSKNSSKPGTPAIPPPPFAEQDGSPSATEEGKKDKKKKKKDEDVYKVPLSRVARLNSPEKGIIAIGLICAFLGSLIYPVYAIVFSEMVGTFYKTGEEQKAEVRKWALVFTGIAVYAGLMYLGRMTCFAIAGEHLTMRLRSMCFRAILRQDISYFDDSKHESGALSAILSKDCSEVHMVFGPALGMHLNNFFGLLVGLFLSFYYSWKVALIALTVVPAVVLAGVLQMAVMQGFSNKSGGAFAKTNQLVVETLNAIRVVTAFNMQFRREQQYHKSLNEITGKLVRRAVMAGVFVGFLQFVYLGTFSLVFWYGGTLISKGELTFIEVMKCASALLFSAAGMGESSSMSKSVSKAKFSAGKVFEIIDRVPPIDVQGGGKSSKDIEGEISFSNVWFSYPSRPTSKILKGLSLHIPRHKHLALIGNTGCGKSTTMQLIERYYDPLAGIVALDGINLKEYDLRELRSHIAIVSQEPTLFNQSVLYNITYGTTATQAEVEEAAKVAHIHDVIMGFPEGYQTEVGNRGSKLSGGQRQRVAIARAILRKPKILLLDEATAALDNQSEAEVQNTLDDVIESLQLTVISIAHRMTSISKADLIAVFHEGQIIEMGSHDELYSLGGDYRTRYDLYHGIAPSASPSHRATAASSSSSSSSSSAGISLVTPPALLSQPAGYTEE